MASHASGSTPFERLKSRFDRDMVCPECGYDDEEGEWLSTTDGSQVVYQHICPSCGKVRQSNYTLGK